MNSPDAIRRLRAIPAETILKTWSHDQKLEFDAIVDGWVIPDQPARIFAEGRQAQVPVLVGSNADEATVFAPGPTTVSDYWKYLREDTGVYAEREFRLWPAASDVEVPGQYLKLQNAVFAYGAWSMARAMYRIGDPAYLYLFTWTGTGKRARLGAFHGEELYFLGDSLPSDWISVDGEKRFGEDPATVLDQLCEVRPARRPGTSRVARLRLEFKSNDGFGEPNSDGACLVWPSCTSGSHATDP